MIDLVALQAQADAGSPDDCLPITRRMLRQIVREIEQGRAREQRQRRAAQAMTHGQQQMDAVVNSIRYEGRVRDRRAPVANSIEVSLIDANDAD